MSKQKRFSKLTIVAGILLTASATCFAQTEPTSAQTESTESVVVAINKAAKFEIRESHPKTSSLDEATTNETRPAFSASQFSATAKESLTNSYLKPSTEIRTETAMNASDFSAPKKTQKVEFVASRGPKLPQ
jgi:hypothetical protein